MRSIESYSKFLISFNRKVITEQKYYCSNETDSFRSKILIGIQSKENIDICMHLLPIETVLFQLIPIGSQSDSIKIFSQGILDSDRKNDFCYITIDSIINLTLNKFMT